MGIFRTPSQGDSISVALRKLLQGGWRGSQAIYKFATKGAGSLDIKDQVWGKEFSVLCWVRCKPLGLLVSFLSYAPQLKSCFPVHPKEWPKAASCIPPAPPQSPCGWGASILRIAVWGARIHSWRPDVLIAATLLVYWCGRRWFHFTSPISEQQSLCLLNDITWCFSNRYSLP